MKRLGRKGKGHIIKYKLSPKTIIHDNGLLPFNFQPIAHTVKVVMSAQNTQGKNTYTLSNKQTVYSM